jgi:hypothetical protein
MELVVYIILIFSSIHPNLPCQVVLLHVLLRAVLARLLPVALGFARATAIAAGTQRLP